MNLRNFILYFAELQSEQSSSIDWGMWGVVATIIVGVAVPIILFIAQIKIKNIEIIRVSSTPLINIDSKYAGDLEIFYQGEKIEDATSIVLGVINTGNQPITKNDFEDSIVIMFNCNTEIIKAGILKTLPTGINPIIETEKNSIVLNPLLINPRDIIIISTIVRSFDGKIDIAGRIKDIKEIKIENKNSKSNLSRMFLSGLLLMLEVMLFSFLVNYNMQTNDLLFAICMSLVIPDSALQLVV